MVEETKDYGYGVLCEHTGVLLSSLRKASQRRTSLKGHIEAKRVKWVKAREDMRPESTELCVTRLTGRLN